MSVAAVLVAGLILLVMFRALTDSMLFYPVRGQWRTPADIGLDFEEIWLEALGEKVQAWWIAAAGSADDTGPVIVFFHGNAGTIADRLENARLMIEQLDADVFLVEYPGYGDSGGKPSEESLFAAGRAALAAAVERAGERRLVLFGRSLGGAVAIELAAADGNAGRVDALIVESSFTSLAELGRALGFPVAAPLLPYRFDSLEKIARIEVPLLVLHGDRDEIVPFPMGRKLYEAATAARGRTFYTIAGAGHNDTLQVGGAPYWRAWREFLGWVEDGC